MMLLAAVTGLGGDRLAGSIITNVGTLTVLSFSRAQESAADRAALEAVYAYYGHVAGADELFRILQDRKDKDSELEIQLDITLKKETGEEPN